MSEVLFGSCRHRLIKLNDQILKLAREDPSRLAQSALSGEHRKQIKVAEVNREILNQMRLDEVEPLLLFWCERSACRDVSKCQFNPFFRREQWPLIISRVFDHRNDVHQRLAILDFVCFA